jgi:hypothetical protein
MKMTPPTIVKDLAEKVGMTPLSWHLADDYIVICFAEGPKMRFDRPKTLPKAVTAAVQTLPARTSKKKK